MLYRDRIVGGVVGAVVGDALGVPVEFTPRCAMVGEEVTDMRGYGTHNQSPGTWSDDSSLMLCTLESLLDGYDLKDMMARFNRWCMDGYMTAHGHVFDIGGTTCDAITDFAARKDPYTCGMSHEHSNGNGSLMRILPLSFYCRDMDTTEIVEKNFEVSALTHAHIRSKLCCAFYSLVIHGLTKKLSVENAMVNAGSAILELVPEVELPILDRILSGAILHTDEDRVSSSGYVVHTLEASLWCVHTSSSFEEAVLKAVNLGGDTDTTGAVTGGLAGTTWGINAIRQDWIQALARTEHILHLSNRLADLLVG